MSETLPKGWVPVKFTDILEIRGGSQPPKKDFIYEPKEGFVRLLQIRDFGDKPFPTYVPLTSKLKIVGKDELLLARYGGTSKDDSLGRICTGMEGAYNVALVKLLFLPEFTPPGFIKHLFGAHFFLEVISKNSRSCQTGFNKDDLKDVSFPLPPLNEQKRIVAKLDRIMPRIDSVKARLDRVPTIIKRFRQSVLTAAVTGKLTEKWREGHPDVENAEVLLICRNYKINSEFKHIEEISEKWCWCALGNYAQLSRGRFSIRPRNDPRYYNGNYPFIQIGDLPREGGYVNEHKQTLNEKGLKVSKEFEKNTIAIAIVGATIGNTGILSYKMCFPDSLIGIETKTKFASVYAEYYLRTEKENIRNISYSSGGQPNIKLPTLTDYPFPLPPLEEQKEIVRQVNKLFALADKLESHYQKAKTHVDKLSQSVLAKAFRGELVPQDPNDEPAEKLLERIIAEKAKMEGGKKKAGGRKKEIK